MSCYRNSLGLPIPIEAGDLLLAENDVPFRYLDTGTRVAVPTTKEGKRVKLVHRRNGREVAAAVPQGFLEVVDGALPSDRMSTSRRRGCRSRLHTVTVDRSSLGRLERHWTADELLSAARAAEEISAEELARAEEKDPLHLQPPLERRSAWSRMRSRANARHLKLGVAGLPVFSQLHYFRCVSRTACVLCYGSGSSVPRCHGT